MDRKLKKEEEKLAKKLKKLCSENGRETDLIKTGKLFHKIANVMRDRNDDKTCYVQSAIMYRAALLRDISNADEIKADLQKLCSGTLRKAGVKSKHPSLLELSQQTLDNVTQFRDKIETKLQDIVVVPEGTRGVELKDLEERKITQVQSIQTSVTTDIIAVMTETIKACMSLLGKPPCGFAVVGIGALARNEVTPYSLFEYVITLQRGSQHRHDYKKVQNYFHWFTTFFNMTLVNLGETDVSNGAIPSLKDLKNSPKQGLVDTVATPGLSFPGLMSIPWIMSPDMPFVQMLKVTDRPNNASARYTMTENLTKTCFVYGDADLYEDYVNTVCNQIWRTMQYTPHANLIAQLSNELDHIKALECLGSKKIFDTNLDPLYIINQGTTVLTYALGRLYNVQASSNYGIVNELLRNKLVAEKYAYQLKYFISVANEMRLKICMKNKRRVRDEPKELVSDSEIRDMFDAVGKKSLIEYFWTAFCLYKDLSQWLKTGDRESLCTTAGFFSKYGGIVYTKTCFYLRLYNDCIKHCKMQLQKSGNAYINAYLYLLGCSFERQGLCLSARDTYETLVRRLEAADKKGNYTINLALVMTRIGCCSMMMQCPVDALPTLTRAHQKYKEANCIESEGYAECVVSLSECYLGLNRFEEIMAMFQKPDRDYKALIINSKFFAVKLRLVIGLSLTDMKKGPLGVEELEDAVELSKKTSENCLVDPLVAESLNAAGICYLEMGNWKRAWTFLQENVGLEDRVTLGRGQLKPVQVASWISTVGICLMKLNRCKEGFQQFERAIALRKNAPKDLRLESLMAQDIHRIAEAYRRHRMYGKALATLQRILPMKTTIINNDPFDFVVIRTYHDKGMIFKDLEKWDSARESFQKELDLIQNIPKPGPPNPSDLAETFQMLLADTFQTASRRQASVQKVLNPAMIDPYVQMRRQELKGGNYLQLGNCMKHDKKHMQALLLYKKSLKAINRAEQYLTMDNVINFNYSLSGMGECLLELGRPEEALMLFRKSLWLSCEITDSAGVDLQIYALYKGMKVCHERMDIQFEEPFFTPLINHEGA